MRKFKGTYNNHLAIFPTDDVTKLETVNGYLYIFKGMHITANNLKSVEGLTIEEGASFTANNLTKITDFLTIETSNPINFPLLKKAENITLNKNANLTAPNISTPKKLSIAPQAQFNGTSTPPRYVMSSAEIKALITKALSLQLENF